MPVCTNCAFPADYLYTTYKTKSNIRLGVCKQCDSFLDPLIEHPDLILLLDLILLKPRVFLHLLFNRGTLPFDADKNEGYDAATRRRVCETRVLEDIRMLASISVVAETAVRILPRVAASSQTGALNALWRTMITVILQGLGQHLVTMAAALLVLRWRGWYPKVKIQDRRDGRQANFTPTLIPLTMLCTSLLPLLLQLMLSIWYTPPPSIHESLPTSTPLSTSLLSCIPFTLPPELLRLEHTLSEAWLASDRVWVGTRLLGGMSAGFGLRVLLPTKPWETTGIVLLGWIAAGIVGRIAEDSFTVT